MDQDCDQHVREWRVVTSISEALEQATLAYCFSPGSYTHSALAACHRAAKAISNGG